MPKKKKPLHRMKTDELAEHFFGKKLKRHLQKLAHTPKSRKSS
jgi:hypothetical protein